ncbi:MAG: hypothetical protein IK100_06155 [Muribaculaceae bacterium]|nr:hypothetical protein [Muribaculaceae bacterium]
MNNNEFLVPSSDERIIFINICRTYKSGERGSIYEATRKYWRLDGKRAEKATHVLAVVNGIVLAVFKPKIWYLTENPEYKITKRWEFDGEEIIDSPHIGKCVRNLLKPSQNPIQYYNM